MICGVDEAGRGCIIGPMVIACATIDPMQEYGLKEIGVKDSKKLSPRQREKLYPQVRKLCKVRSIIISAEKITSLMDKHNLNEIEAMYAAKLLEHVPAKSTAYIDSPDNIPANFGKRVHKYLKNSVRLVCENKADYLHLIVGAASIVAKYERDAEIEKIKKEIGYDFNSGYTADPYTIAFLEKYASDKGVQKYIRQKWATLDNIRQRKLPEF